jgi:integrase
VRQLGPATVEALRQHLVERETHRRRVGSAYDDQGFVFSRPDGRPMHRNTFRERLARASEAAGIVGLRPKDLRSTSETLLHELGYSPTLVSKW